MTKHNMRKRIQLFISFICLSLFSIISSTTKAEGNCPPGYYPVGVQGCALFQIMVEGVAVILHQVIVHQPQKGMLQQVQMV
ncbi:MAG: hypothetical protein GAK29_03469 [Acinetobacter bereziniae]|uniref:Secreted protein n=1 Tax=Acinetobacter bereziniae TaxID=106648 RepID=A0A833PDM3_ACIBZ|nr:MAG: hypothetical protein GAK29_03469 [Acinetobacter bereziniae]